MLVVLDRYKWEPAKLGALRLEVRGRCEMSLRSGRPGWHVGGWAGEASELKCDLGGASMRTPGWYSEPRILLESRVYWQAEEAGRSPPSCLFTAAVIIAIATKKIGAGSECRAERGDCKGHVASAVCAGHACAFSSLFFFFARTLGFMYCETAD